MVAVRASLSFLMAVSPALLTPLLMSVHFSQQAWHELPMAKLQVTLASLLPGTTVVLGTSVIHVSVGKEINSDETTTSPTLIHRFPKSTEN